MTNSNPPPAVAATELFKSPEANLLDWLERFAEKLKGQTNAVADEVQQVVDQMGAVELNLQNTFNSFRCLSSSQFVENRVYEEDETDVVSTGIPKRDAKQTLMPTESYEDEILPRYKDAVASAWAAFQKGSRQRGQSSLQAGPRSKPRDSHHDERIQILPHIIGTEEFTRDVHCGLADFRQSHHDSEFDTDVETETGDSDKLEKQTTQPTRILSEEETSGTDSDAFDYQEGGLEPAVSAALDFKAMLEAALRNPYDGGTSNDSVFGDFGDSKFSLPNLANDNLGNSPRTISTMVDIIGRTMSTMDESKDELRHDNSQGLIRTGPPMASMPPEGSGWSSERDAPAPFRPLEPVEDDATNPPTIEELLKKTLNPVTQATLNQEFQQYVDNDRGNRKVGSRDLGLIPGGLFDDEAHDRGFLTTEHTVLPNSNTGPTIPEGLFEEQLPLDAARHTRTDSQSSSSLDSSRLILDSPVADVNTVSGPSNQNLDNIVKDEESKGSDKSKIRMSPPVSLPEHSASSSVSSGSNVLISSQQTGLLPFRGGLFDVDDDDDDDGEDAGDLFGASAPKVESQPVVRAWASRSSKGLFDDLEGIIDTKQEGTSRTSDGTGTSQVRHNSGILPFLTSQYDRQSAHGTSDLHQQVFETASAITSPENADLDLVTPGDLKEMVSEKQNDEEREDIQRPIQSMLASAVRSSVTVIVDSDEESWSNSESEDGEVIQKTDPEHYVPKDNALEFSETTDSKASAFEVAEGISPSKPEVAVDIDQYVQTVLFTDNASPVVSLAEGENIVSNPQSVIEAPQVQFHPGLSRSFSATDTSPIRSSITLAESPLLLPKSFKTSDADESDVDPDSSPRHSPRIGQLQPEQKTFSGRLGRSENLLPSTSQPNSFENETPTSQSQSKVQANSLFSEDVSTIASKDLTIPVNEFGNSITRRTFTSLFEDDDADEDLFGQGSFQHRGVLLPKTGKHGAGFLSDTTFPIGQDGQGSRVQSGPPLVTRDIYPQLSQTPTPPTDILFPPRSVHVDNKESDLPSAKSGSKLSSLLFGDDDEEDEAALFGPLGGQTTRGSNRMKSDKAVFGDVNLLGTSSSRPPRKGQSLFDD